MKTFILSAILCIIATFSGFAQAPNHADASLWQTISDDDIVTIAYSKKITTDKNGYHYVWVKADYHWEEWQNYFSNTVGISTPTAFTITRAQYSDDYNFAIVRQVLLYNKSGRQLFDTGDDRSAGWLPVNASDPVGIVGEYLGDEHRKIRY